MCLVVSSGEWMSPSEVPLYSTGMRQVHRAEKSIKRERMKTVGGKFKYQQLPRFLHSSITERSRHKRVTPVDYRQM